MITSAQISSCGAFRWELERIWGFLDRICLFVMLNPSTADAMLDDRTVQRCIAFAKAWGYDGIRIVNLVAFRATQPVDMLKWFHQQSQTTLLLHRLYAINAARRVDVAAVICAFGSVPATMRSHTEALCEELKGSRKLYVIKLNKDGTPAHPLYLRADLTPIPYLRAA